MLARAICNIEPASYASDLKLRKVSRGYAAFLDLEGDLLTMGPAIEVVNPTDRVIHQGDLVNLVTDHDFEKVGKVPIYYALKV